MKLMKGDLIRVIHENDILGPDSISWKHYTYKPGDIHVFVTVHDYSANPDNCYFKTLTPEGALISVKWRRDWIPKYWEKA